MIRPSTGCPRFSSNSTVGWNRELRPREHFHRGHAKRHQDIAIRRIAGGRHGDAVARLERRQEPKQKSGGRASCHHDPALRHGNAVAVVIEPGNRRAQRRNAESVGITQPVAVQCPLRRLDHGGRRSGRRLPDLQMKHLAAGRFPLRRGPHHFHHDERGDGSPLGDFQRHNLT